MHALFFIIGVAGTLMTALVLLTLPFALDGEDMGNMLVMLLIGLIAIVVAVFGSLFLV